MRLKLSLLLVLSFAALAFAGRPASPPAVPSSAEENLRLLQSLEQDLAAEKQAVARIQHDLDEEKRRLLLLQRRTEALRGRIAPPAPAPRKSDPLTPTY